MSMVRGWGLSQVIDYLSVLTDMEEECEEFKKDILQTFFENGTPKIRFYAHTPRYHSYFDPIARTIEVCEIFGINHLDQNKDSLLRRVRWLEDPRAVSRKDLFLIYVDFIKDVFSDVREERQEVFSTLGPAERERLNEAIHCFLEGCNYSAVVMSVSAIEFRLLNLMQAANSDERLEKLTLGQLINEYLTNKEKYKNVIPEKHESLLNLCNTYRIFSVHPKKEKIIKRTANSILNLTFEFLLDEKLRSQARINDPE